MPSIWSRIFGKTALDSELEKLANEKPKASVLLTEQAGPDNMIRTASRASAADGLTPARLGALLRAADEGDTQAYFVLCAEIEERDGAYAHCLQTRKLAVVGAPVQVEAASDSAHDKAIAEAVERVVAKPEFGALKLDLLDGTAKGFSACEIMWSRSAREWMPTSYTLREQRHFQFDLPTMTVPSLRSASKPDGDPLAPYKWAIHTPRLRSGIPIRVGLARTACVIYAAKRFNLESWMKFLEVYSMPSRIGKYPSGTSSADQAKLYAAVKRIGTDAAAIIPEEMVVEFLETRSGGGNSDCFLKTSEYWDGAYARLVLGQTLTSGGDKGGSYALGKVHEGVMTDITKADAGALSDTINRDIVRAFVDLNFGAQTAYPRVTIQIADPEDATALMANVKTFVELGGEVEMSSLRDRLGLVEPAPGAQLLSAPNAAALVGPVDQSAKSALKRELLSTSRQSEDDVDASVRAALDGGWMPILDPVVGESLRRVLACDTYEQATALIDEMRLEGLDLGPLTESLARETFRLRGIGDAS